MEREEYLCPLVTICGVYGHAGFSEKFDVSRKAVIKTNNGKYFCERMPKGIPPRELGDTSGLPECALVAILNKIGDKK